MQETLKHLKGYFNLKLRYTSKEMKVKLYAGLITYRKVTDGPSVNPMDFIFSSKPLLNIATSYGFTIYMSLHLKQIAEPIRTFTKDVVSSTYSLYQATTQGNEAKKADCFETIIRLHKDIDSFLKEMPKEIEHAVNHLAFKQMNDSSLEKRMERLMERKD